MDPIYFESPPAFRTWLQKNHAREKELLVGFHKRGTGRPSLSWPESVDEALCYGWIDGVRRSVDAERYTIRFTPRKARSVWSQVNIRRAKALIETGRMSPAGLAAFEARDEAKTRQYSFERENVALDPAYEREFRRSRKAWRFFESQPPSYRKTALWYVMSAKREETRRKRLRELIEDSSAGLRLKGLRK